MKSLLVLTWFMLLVIGPGYAQLHANTRADSLRAWLRQPGLADSARIRHVLELAGELRDTPELAGLEPALRQALALARRGERIDDELALHMELGDLATQNGDAVAAGQAYNAALTRARQTGHTRDLAHYYEKLGGLAIDQEAPARAIALLTQAVAEARRPDQQKQRAGALAYLSTLYLEAGKTAPARRCFWEALAIHRQARFRLGEFHVLSGWGNGLRNRQPDSAVYYLLRARTIAQELQNPTALAFVNLVLMQAHENQHDWPAMLRAARQTCFYARQSHTRTYEAEGLSGVAAALRQLGRSAQAYDTLDASQTMLRSIWDEEAKEEVARQQVRFDVGEQRVRIKALEQQRRLDELRAERQRTRTYGLLGGLLGFGGLSLLLLRSRRRLQRSEAELRAANLTKDQLMRIVGHDLRGPVASLQLLTPLLHDVIEQPEKATAHELICTLDAGTQNLGGLVDNLFQWARAQGGQLVNEPVRLPAAQAMASIAELYTPAAQLKSINLRTSTSPELLCWADMGLLSTVLRNLVGNALKFTPTGGTVELQAAATADGTVEFSVTDSGPGLPPQKMRDLLTVDRVESTPGTNGEPGTGLGLPLSARFVARLGGELHLENAPGGGMRCWFRVPGLPRS